MGRTGEEDRIILKAGALEAALSPSLGGALLWFAADGADLRSEEHTSELQSH